MNGSDIKDGILRDWWDREFKGRDHENWPFCDPSYSTVMPGADFTVAIREFLIAGKLEAIRELLWIVSTESSSWGLQLDLAMEALASQAYPDTDEGRMLAELDAIVLLGMRSAFHTSRDESYVITTMAKCSLPVWLADEKSQPAVKSLRTMPVTCRDMILERVKEMPEGQRCSFRLRAIRYYGDRCFGNSMRWNISHIESCGLFCLPDDRAPLPSYVTKAIIVAEGKQAELDWNPSWKRDVLIEEARKAKLMAVIRSKHAPEERTFQDQYTQGYFLGFLRYVDSVWGLMGAVLLEERLLRLCSPGLADAIRRRS